jgi:hypothetical protein
VFTTACHLPPSEFIQFMPLFFLTRSILIALHLRLGFPSDSFLQVPNHEAVCRFFSMYMPCVITDVSQNKGPLHAVTWLGHLLALTGTQNEESLLADSLI